MKTKFKIPKKAKKIPVNDIYLQSFSINGFIINVWSNKKNRFFTVGVRKPGFEQQFQKFCDKKEVESILKNEGL